MPAPTAEHRKTELERIICDSVQGAIGLREILTNEREALERQDTIALHSAATEKEVCIRKLESLEKERAELSVACGFASGPEDMQSLLAWCNDELPVKDTWRHFLEVATTCNDLNATNGSIIRLRRSQIQNALELLRGGNLEPEPYSPEGRKPAGNTGRALAHA